MILFRFFQLQCCGISTNSTETGKPWESWYSNLKINSGSASKKVRHLKGTNKVSILGVESLLPFGTWLFQRLKTYLSYVTLE